MIYHLLSFKLTAILFSSSLFGSELNNDALNMNSLSSLFYNQDLNIEENPADPLKDDKTLFKNGNFCIFINLLKNLREKLSNVKTNKNQQSANYKAMAIAKSLMKESEIASKIDHNRVSFFVYLCKSIDLIENFLPYFNEKKNYESAMKLPDSIKLVVSEILSVEVLLPVIIDLLEKEEILTKASTFKHIKNNLIKFDKQIYDFRECFEHYWHIITVNFQFYNFNFQPIEMYVKLNNRTKFILKMKEKKFQDEANLYNNVYVLFEDLYKCIENENVCFKFLLRDLDNIWMISEKIIDQLEFIKEKKEKE